MVRTLGKGCRGLLKPAFDLTSVPDQRLNNLASLEGISLLPGGYRDNFTASHAESTFSKKVFEPSGMHSSGSGASVV
ncbi:MAG: hypothetical protein RIS76_1932 [Verrucomicrobiota bacterium]|jgi:hypothetical protein